MSVPTPMHHTRDPRGGQKPPEMTMENLDLITDFFVMDDAPDSDAFGEAFCFADSYSPIPLWGTEVAEFLAGVLLHIRQEHKHAINFSMHYQDQYVFRVHREFTVMGTQLCIRRVKGTAPDLAMMSFKNPYWVAMLNSDRLINGGIVLFASKPGSGKSTTMGGTVVSRLKTYSGFAKTIESPVELPLSNRWGDGVCYQTEVDENLPIKEQYAKPMREIALRGFPAIPGGGRTILMLGEVRDPETAALVVQSAVGHLVLTSIHAQHPESACSRLASMAGEILGRDAAQDMLASSLRVVVSQHLENNPMAKAEWQRKIICGDILWSHSYNSPVANSIRKGEWPKIQNLMREQSLKMDEAQRQSLGAAAVIGQLSKEGVGG